MHTICVAGILPARAEGVPPLEELVCTPHPTSIEQTLAAVRLCMARRAAPWPQEWQAEYVDTIRAAIATGQEDPQYPKRLQILQEGFGPYWNSFTKDGERSLFEVHQAEIRWYVENLMAADLPREEETQVIRRQYEELADHAAESLPAQFSFLDPNLVQRAKADHLAECHRNIEAPLVPIYRMPFSEAQMDRMKERWRDLRYARVDLWRSLGGHGVAEAQNHAPRPVEAKPSNEHPDYLLTQRSLDQWRGQLWSVIPGPPDCYAEAVSQEIATQKKRLREATSARSQEERLGVEIWQTEYLSFLLTALLETAEISQNGVVK